MTVLASRAQLRASFLRWALFIVPVVLLLGFLSGMVANSGPNNPWFASLVKPSLYPPPQVFGIVWSILYVMIGLAAALVATAWGARGRGLALAAFVVQFCVNLAWSPVFFGLHQMTTALYVIGAMDVLVAITIALFWRVRWQAGALLLPYLAWICFATALNWQFLQQNPDADGSAYSGAVQRIELHS